MKLSLFRLKHYIDISLSPEELANVLTMAGLEVEEIETIGKIPDGVIVAKIISRRKHENSDHLSICEVFTGSETLQIVCGAPNCDTGNIVPLATIGTVFRDGEGGTFTIKKGKIRGAESFGMMCSAKELGLSEDHKGLMLLPGTFEIGKPLQDYVPTDTVYTLEITPNRPDWLSYWGVARDIAALVGGELKFPAPENVPTELAGDWNNLVSVEAPDLCPLYTARVIRGVKVGESPAWLKASLAAIGIRPINNIVDITNFVMMELGEPLHVFDMRFLKGDRIVVRRAADGEAITALDGKTYDLTSNDLVIADTEKPVAIAGVMGGEYSGVVNDTTDVVLESAWFDPASVRATSRRLGLSSEASYRFERGADRAMIVPASNRAAQLILELAGGRLVSNLVSVAEPAPAARIIDMKYDRVRSLLGMDVGNRRIDEILHSLGFDTVRQSETGASFSVPTWRELDVMGSADLAEEVARIHGLDKLPDVPIKATQSDISRDDILKLTHLREEFVAVGLCEIVSNSMMSEASAIRGGIFEPADLIRPSNPISLDLAVMRPSLLPCLLDAVRYNIARKNYDLGFFEIGHVFCANQEKYPEERDEIGIAITGCAHPERYSKERSAQYDFFDLKGILESVLNVRRIASFSFVPAKDPRFAPACCAELIIDGKKAGILGQAAPELTKGMRLNTPLFIALIQLDAIFGAREKSLYYSPISQFPSVSRDIAFIAPAKLQNQDVVDFIRKQHLPFLESVSIFDVFEGKAIGEGRKSLAYSLVFRSPDRTLTDEEVNVAYEKIRKALADGLKVELR
ncbi:MAG: phenylalanine--tRNA ligase subunit beta [Lentisphaeria bacterium]|nr:phenylalanine--tRNA ligase subunit beta [Lentisphaeria bacterium]